MTQTLVDEIGPVVDAVADPDAGLQSALQSLVYDNLNGTGLLLKPDGDPIEDPSDIEVYTDCNGSCAGKNITDLVDVRVIFAVGQTVETDVPFDLGLDGVPLRLAGAVHPEVGWSFVVDLGLNRNTGPYVGVDRASRIGTPGLRAQPPRRHRPR